MAVDQLSTVFGALADPTRRAILVRLRQGDASVQEITAPFGLSQPAVSRHLKVLEAAGLVSRHRRATTRLSHLEAEPLREATVWLASYQAYWDETFDRLDDLLVSLIGDTEPTHEPQRPNDQREEEPANQGQGPPPTETATTRSEDRSQEESRHGQDARRC